MEFTDIKTWTVTADHKARPKNQYDNWGDPDYRKESLVAFEAFANQHTYHCDETLKPGDYPAEMFDSPVWQLENMGIWFTLHLASQQSDGDGFSYQHYIDNGRNVRLYLPLKPSSKEPEVKQQGGEWISVDAGYPTHERKVRAIITYGSGRMEEIHTNYVKRIECFDSFFTDQITHWQEIVLPSPPKSI